MNNFKVIIGFSNSTDVDFMATSDHIYSSMKYNTSFPSPLPTVPDMLILNDAFREALSKADRGKGGVQATTIKNKARLNLEEALQDWGMYVETTAKNDEVKLISSGFSIKAERTPGTATVAPVNLKAKDGQHSGECVVKFKGASNALMYTLRYKNNANPSENWVETVAFTKSTYTIANQPRAIELAIEVMAMNGHGESDWSDPITWLVR